VSLGNRDFKFFLVSGKDLPNFKFHCCTFQCF